MWGQWTSTERFLPLEEANSACGTGCLCNFSSNWRSILQISWCKSYFKAGPGKKPIAPSDCILWTFFDQPNHEASEARKSAEKLDGETNITLPYASGCIKLQILHFKMPNQKHWKDFSCVPTSIERFVPRPSYSWFYSQHYVESNQSLQLQWLLAFGVGLKWLSNSSTFSTSSSIWGAVKTYYMCLVCFWTVIVFLRGPLSFYSVSHMYKVMFNPSLQY